MEKITIEFKGDLVFYEIKGKDNNDFKTTIEKFLNILDS